ncbi:hypothetical protein [Sphingomonas olei]|uniref:Uncharacterized protein n=1 Tax=Sphingomonas olei TaxID=1886787 RepID=A0ABY2QEF1_9SPHN|nr:hypothetical protein [Sphingomonas olei]THG37786.1 hypothetical protein E5988_15665 [Sphingomonas olei]
MTNPDSIVAVGLLTQRDLDLLGKSFDRHFPVQDDDMFADILAQLDQVEAVPLGNGLSLVKKRG